ncbi:winged helix-turn-helix domain-containing protein [Chloroflexota bacterium]
MKTLIIDDDLISIKDVSFCLQARYPDIEIISAEQAIRGIELSGTEFPDLIVMGSSLPDMPTTDIIEQIRENSDAALIVLAEGQTGIERAEELESGADDYIIKPFSPIEFLAKVTALLRRIKGFGFRPHRRVSINGLIIDFSTREVFISGERLKLTPTEYNLLIELVKNEGKVITHNTLLEKIWGSEYINDPSFIKKYVHRLRSKIEPDAGNPRMIINERGIGYRFERMA